MDALLSECKHKKIHEKGRRNICVFIFTLPFPSGNHYVDPSLLHPIAVEDELGALGTPPLHSPHILQEFQILPNTYNHQKTT